MKTVEHLPRAHYAAVMLPTITSARASATPSSSLGKRRAMTSSERGIKFRKKQRERSAMLERSTATLRAELSRLQALRDVWQSASFAPTRGGTPVQFAREFFAQFRDGVFRVGDRQRLRQEEFLSAMAEPGALLDGEPLARALLHSLERESELYPTLRVDLESTEALTADGCAVVVCKGCKRLRYSRRAIEVLYPHASRDEQLVRKLVGRQLRVPFLTKLFFGEKGRLTGIETDDQVAGALYDVLRDLGDCAAVLGPAPVDAWRLCCKDRQQERHLP